MTKLHVGCNTEYLQGYVNIDISPAATADVYADVLTLDYMDVDAIYSCHSFEHLSYYENAIKALSLYYKWLRNGGILRLSVPDLMLVAKAYVNGSDMKFIYGADFKGYYHKDTPCERFNFFLREWEHKLHYDFDQLSMMLVDAGFDKSRIKKCKPNESSIPSFAFDRFIPESLYIECVK